jgi:hypothetical protein
MANNCCVRRDQSPRPQVFAVEPWERARQERAESLPDTIWTGYNIVVVPGRCRSGSISSRPTRTAPRPRPLPDEPTHPRRLFCHDEDAAHAVLASGAHKRRAIARSFLVPGTAAAMPTACLAVKLAAWAPRRAPSDFSPLAGRIIGLK